MHQPLKTFICYAHEDHEVVAALRKHLTVFEKRGLLEIWFDGKILPGENWDNSIKAKLKQAELLLMFVSVDFINSEYIEKTELKAALQRHRDGEASLVPIIVRACHWEDYFEIGKFQALPKGARPILSGHFPFRDDAFHEVAEGVRQTAHDWIGKLKIRLEEEAKKAEAEAQKRQAEAEKAEKTRHRHDETFWKKVLRELESGDDPTHKIALLKSYLDSETHQNHRVEAEEHIEEIEAEMEATRKFASAREKTEADRRQKEVAALAARRARDPFLEDMVLVEGGSFQMGSNKYNDEKPIHTVMMPSFYISKYPVTQRQWQKVMGNNPSHFKGDERLPVESVSWDDVQAFLKKLNEQTGQQYRLPSEAEWEYAARGGKKSKGYEYAGSDTLDEVGWYDANSGSKTHPIGLKKANELGLYDMSGNVWEWCEDDGHDNYEGASKDGSAWVDDPRVTFRVFRGSGWGNVPLRCRAASRGDWRLDDRRYDLGFRLAHSL